MKQLFIHTSSRTTQSALLENGMLAEFHMETSEGASLIGNIYKGKVVNVLPGMQAAFVDIGLNKNAFLYVDDVLHPHLDKQPKEKPSISDLLHPGDELVVQLMKEPLGGKGARVTTHYSLPGRWIVYMPQADYVGISKKIDQEAERDRLKILADHIRREDEGVIIRTNASGVSGDAIAADLAALRDVWDKVSAADRESTAPALLHRDSGLVHRLLRDVIASDVTQISIDDPDCLREVRAYLQNAMPALADTAQLYASDRPMFQTFGIKEQLDKAFQPKIWLPSGGYLVWDQTEALTVIDVNTGKYTGSTDLEETVFQTNAEAAQEIARLLRLRDIGGIVIVDFIDMDIEEHRTQVVQLLEQTMKRDRTKCQVVGWTRLGLLEMTRKKTRENAMDYFYEPCAACNGSGKIYVR